MPPAQWKSVEVQSRRASCPAFPHTCAAAKSSRLQWWASRDHLPASIIKEEWEERELATSILFPHVSWASYINDYTITTAMRKCARNYSSLSNKRIGTTFQILGQNLDQGSLIIFDQWKSFRLIDWKPSFTSYRRPGIKSIKKNNLHWSKIITEPWSRFCLKIR